MARNKQKKQAERENKWVGNDKKQKINRKKSEDCANFNERARAKKKNKFKWAAAAIAAAAAALLLI